MNLAKSKEFLPHVNSFHDQLFSNVSKTFISSLQCRFCTH